MLSSSSVFMGGINEDDLTMGPIRDPELFAFPHDFCGMEGLRTGRFSLRTEFIIV